MHTDIYLNHGNDDEIQIHRYDDKSVPWYTLKIGKHEGGITLYLTDAQLREIVAQGQIETRDDAELVCDNCGDPVLVTPSGEYKHIDPREADRPITEDSGWYLCGRRSGSAFGRVSKAHHVCSVDGRRVFAVNDAPADRRREQL